MKIIKIFSLSILVLLMSGCSKDFLNRYPTSSLANDIALTTVPNCQAAAVGLYSTMGVKDYVGRTLTVWGDLASDNASTKGIDAGHLWPIEQYSITTSLVEIETMWNVSYAIISRATRIMAGTKLLLGQTTLAADQEALEIVIAQCYAIRAYSMFMLTNLFCLPYPTTINGITKNPASMDGMVVMTTQVPALNTPVPKVSLEATYAAITSDLVESIACFTRGKKEVSQADKSQYFISKAAVAALQARVALTMGKWEDAKTFAQSAIDLRKGSLVTDFGKYFDMWSVTDITTEDIFTINKDAKTQLSAESINNFYNSYGGNFSPSRGIFRSTDMRKKLFDKLTSTQCSKYPNSYGMSNIPVIRLPEMYLIKAEAKYHLSDESGAQADILLIAQRDTTVKTITETGDALYQRIKLERRKETMGEGLRWMDLRRWGDSLVRKSDDYRFPFQHGFSVKDFAYPIPDGERNANSAMKQNEVWASGSVYLPEPKTNEK